MNEIKEYLINECGSSQVEAEREAEAINKMGQIINDFWDNVSVDDLKAVTKLLQNNSLLK